MARSPLVAATSPLADRYRADGWWQRDRLTDDVARHAAARPERTAVADPAHRLTWAALWDRARSTAARLRDLGVAPGDVVSSQLPNGVDCVVLHLAAELAGAVHHPLAVQFRTHELDQVCGLLDSRLVVHPGSWHGTDYADLHARTRLGQAGRTVAVAALGAGTADAADTADRPVESPTDPTAPAFVLNTSGTVAIKGVVHTHEEAQYSVRTVAGLMRLTHDDTIVCAIPMSWGGGLCWGVRLALHTGATLVALERWEARTAADTIDAEGATFTYGPPTLARDLVDLADEWTPGRPLRMICAGAPIPRQMCIDARTRLGLELVPGYGQTEHLHSTLGRLDDALDHLTGSDGRALPGVELVAVGDDDEPVPSGTPGTPGALLCRGPNVAAGYARQPELSAETFRADGWQVTQDLGAFDADGYLRVVGRIRDLIIRGGLNVSPREVEELLLRHPDVADAAVVGEPDDRYGERICAFVVPAGGAAPTVATLTEMLTDLGVAKYKHPERVVAIDALPLTTTGKVRHAALREQLAGDPQG